ncbi:MAG: hypothetical protein IPJ27_02000 [Candidatus Accumulibacter sp.]|uniref:Uncharacterized protein n=1 Tax=Candidatus Accumulibacter proximus TaxID=2954385 RepID=A0A935PWP9_9PROT|nr:hypothetical protein [Candidatus Accumulibacter proximus]
MSSWLQIASGHANVVGVIAVGIVVSAALGYWGWFSPRIAVLVQGLRKLTEALSTQADMWPAANERAKEAVKDNPALRPAWQETTGRVIALPHGGQRIHVMFGAPRDIWSAQRLLAHQMNLPLAEAVPNLLVGVGLAFTFFFLTVALTHATSALGEQAGQQADLLNATRGLLSTAGAKFLTSLAGLIASICWTFASKRKMAELNRQIELVLERLGVLLPVSGGEMVMFAQLNATRDIHQSSTKHLEVSTDLGALTEELLNESREQTGTFKRFETDLAVSLAGAITKAFSPQMEAMTSKLVVAIEGLSDKIGTMNQEALERMIEDFSATLKKATDSEMTQLRETLVALSSRLDGAGDAIGRGAETAVAALDRAGTDLVARVEAVAAGLGTGAANLEAAAQSLKVALNDLDVSISDAAKLGEQGADFFRGALASMDGAIGKLDGVSTGLGEAMQGLERVAGAVLNALDGIEELSHEQRGVIQAVKDAMPQTLGAVERVATVLNESIASSERTMERMKDNIEASVVNLQGAAAQIAKGVDEYSKRVASLQEAMGQELKETVVETAAALKSTVASMLEGVTEYSNEVAELHRTMDQHLAKAIGSLDKGVVGLEESIEELGEILSPRMAAA